MISEKNPKVISDNRTYYSLFLCVCKLIGQLYLYTTENGELTSVKWDRDLARDPHGKVAREITQSCPMPNNKARVPSQSSSN